MDERWLDEIRWTGEGLVAAVVQEYATDRVLMLAWMNREALIETVKTGRATYWSRSRGRLWRKGEQSGHSQIVREIRLDCDGDALLLKVDQKGGIACHTGRPSCFFRVLQGDEWRSVDPVLREPLEIYGDSGDGNAL
jgi:phosphoribosyl-AMP cyclohydrolase